MDDSFQVDTEVIDLLSDVLLFLVVTQVLEKLDAVQAERDKLEDQWNKKKIWLESVYLEQVFYRDLNSMDKTSSSQEVRSFFVLQ